MLWGIVQRQDFINIRWAKEHVIYYDWFYNTGKSLWEISEKQVGIVITLHILSENAS